MRQQYHFRDSSQGLLSWDVFRLIELSKDLDVFELPLNKIKELDEAFWYDLGGAKPACKNIIEHAKLINQANLDYPIILCHQGRVMDGMHRVGKAILLNRKSIKAVQFEFYVEPDYIGLSESQLPYNESKAKVYTSQKVRF